MMRMIEVDVPMTTPSFETAKHLALEIALANQMQQPMIVSWHSHRDGGVSPRFEGGNPEGWWEKYGKGNYGELEITVSKAYDFVVADSRGYETLDDMPLSNLKDSSGNAFICYTSMLGDSRIPDSKACTPADEWLAKQT
jgi:hypothetical protein